MNTSLSLHRTYPLNALALVIIGIFVAIVSVSAIAISVFSGQAHFEKVGFINVASVVLFVGCCVFSLQSTKFYFFFLPFIFIAFPAAVNDFFPSVLLGNPSEIGSSAFPLITHIDLFLLLGIFKKSLTDRIVVRGNLLLVTVAFLFLMSFTINLLEATTDFQRMLLLVAGLFPLRYLLLLVVLLSNYDLKKYEWQIIFSLIISIVFLFVESLINTAITGVEKLASGTLGSNTFSNIVASILVFFIFIKRKHFPINNLVFIVLISLSVTIILLTGTRISILAGAMAFFLLQAYLFNWRRMAVVGFWIAVIAIAVYNYVDVPDRYSVKQVAAKIHFYPDASNIANMVHVEPGSETNSIRTRLRLYQTALYMLVENPVWGTGYGTFNYLKGQYGFKDLILIDAHNGYLNTLAQLGFSAVFFLYLIYLYPILNFKEVQDKTFLACLAFINLTMAICDLSNAGIYKSPAFALLAFNAVVISMLKRQGTETEHTLPVK